MVLITPFSHVKYVFGFYTFNDFFLSRFSCPYTTFHNSGNYSDNRFFVNGQIGGQHKDNAIVKFFESDINYSGVDSSSALVLFFDLVECFIIRFFYK